MAHDDTGDLRFFISLVEAGSLTAAARLHGATPSAISRRLSRVENRLESVLVFRSTRHFSLTQAGRIYYERALDIVVDIDHLEEAVSDITRVPRGTLGIGAPVELGRQQIAPFLETFSRKHPEISLNLALTAEGAHELSDSLDVVLRLGMPETAGAVVTRLASTVRVLCASPAYVARRGMPGTLADLAEHECLCLRRSRTMALLNRWVVGDENGSDVITVHPRLSTTSAEVIHDWALTGQGIAYKLLCDVWRDFEQGRLVRILSHLQGEKIDLYAVQPPRLHTRASVRLFLKELRPYIRELGFFD